MFTLQQWRENDQQKTDRCCWWKIIFVEIDFKFWYNFSLFLQTVDIRFENNVQILCLNYVIELKKKYFNVDLTTVTREAKDRWVLLLRQLADKCEIIFVEVDFNNVSNLMFTLQQWREKQKTDGCCWCVSWQTSVK